MGADVKVIPPSIPFPAGCVQKASVAASESGMKMLNHCQDRAAWMGLEAQVSVLEGYSLLVS